MIWIINGKTLASNSSINYRLYKKAYSFHFIIPEYSSIIEGYHMDEFKEYLFETDFFQNLKDDPDLKNFSEDNGCWFEFDYYNKKDFHSIERNFYYTVREILNELYGYYDSEEIRKNFDSHFHLNHKDLYQIIVFKKKHWRKFIDECKFPVFIHLLDGLDDSLLYWYQKNKIITLKSFLNKYIKYS
ncbi:hypothetical protein ACFX5F_13350 [Flavobacterium sp. ZS1P70]|uniref:Uncharacterized protein n=1 Tax=Flavobacterium zhoui TaxID=3230414 RepID=A0ABW6I7P1_9FLAO